MRPNPTTIRFPGNGSCRSVSNSAARFIRYPKTPRSLDYNSHPAPSPPTYICTTLSTWLRPHLQDASSISLHTRLHETSLTGCIWSKYLRVPPRLSPPSRGCDDGKSPISWDDVGILYILELLFTHNSTVWANNGVRSRDGGQFPHGKNPLFYYSTSESSTLITCM